MLAAVECLQAALVSSPFLAYFDVHAAATDLYTDASGGSIGAVLQQTDRDGNVRPVGALDISFLVFPSQSAQTIAVSVGSCLNRN